METEHRGLSLHREATTQEMEAELASVFRQAQRHLTRYAWPPLSPRDVIIRLTVTLQDVVMDRARTQRKETKTMRPISGVSRRYQRRSGRGTTAWRWRGQGRRTPGRCG